MTIAFDSHGPSLSQREREIVVLIAGGHSAKQIAQIVGIAPRTVERHIENCRNKLNARNRTHLVARAIAHGEVEIGMAPVLAP